MPAIFLLASKNYKASDYFHLFRYIYNFSEYPNLFTRVNSPENLNWILEEAFGEEAVAERVDTIGLGIGQGNHFKCQEKTLNTPSE